MKNGIKILLGSIALALGGVSAAGLAYRVNGEPTAQVSENSTVSIDNNNDNDNNSNSSLGILHMEKSFGNDAAPAPAANSTASAFDFTGMILNGVKSGGTSLIGTIVGKVGTIAFNKIMTSIGVDMRDASEKKLDQIQTQLNGIQSELRQGISDIIKKMTKMHNDDIMNKLLEKFSCIETPVASKMATMIDLSRKELDAKYDKNELAKEKETFYKGLDDMKFDKLDGNTLWAEAQNLAKAVLSPYPASSLKLEDLYEGTYGMTETWDYMTIAPRTRFMGYIASLVNSLATLANLKACYEMGKFKDGDSNLLGYKVGLKGMAEAVTAMNNKFKDELAKLDAIQKKHDEQHIITHRDQVVDKDGNVSYKDGVSVSTRLLAVTTADNDHNYISYKHTGKNPVVGYTHGYGDAGGSSEPIYSNYVYTLDCTSMQDLYKTVINEYSTYSKAMSQNGKAISMQDYLVKAGFACEEKDMFAAAKGFYNRIECSQHKGSQDSWWKDDTRNELRVRYFDFTKDGKGEDLATYSATRRYKDGWFASDQYSGNTTDQLNNVYLVFVSTDQKTIQGKMARTEVSQVMGANDQSEYYKRHYQGHRTFEGKEGDAVTI